MPVAIQPGPKLLPVGPGHTERNADRISTNPQGFGQAGFAADQDCAGGERRAQRYSSSRTIRCQPAQESVFIGTENLQAGGLNPVQATVERCTGFDGGPRM